MKLGAVDIGSNAVRFQVTNVLEHEGNVTFKKVEYLRSSERNDRARIRRDHLYLREAEGANRYPRLSALRPWMKDYLGPTSDLLAWRLIFKWTFRLRDDVQKQVQLRRRRTIPHLRLLPVTRVAVTQGAGSAAGSGSRRSITSRSSTCLPSSE